MDKILLERDLLLSENVTESSVKGLIEQILKINYDDKLKSKEFKDFEIPPINLYINTYGGSAYNGFALMNIIINSTTPITTIAAGSIMSMGLPIYLCGSKRISYQYSTFMYHEATTVLWDKIETMKQDLKEVERIQEIMDNLILSKTNILADKLKEVREKKLDWYITPNEALKLGIVEQII